MKVYISADIEGIATTAKWPETWPSDREYPYHAEEMTREVLACCRAAIDAVELRQLLRGGVWSDECRMAAAGRERDGVAVARHFLGEAFQPLFLAVVAPRLADVIRGGLGGEGDEAPVRGKRGILAVQRIAGNAGRRIRHQRLRLEIPEQETQDGTEEHEYDVTVGEERTETSCQLGEGVVKC